MWSHILMILNFWPDAFLAFFWKIPGSLSPHTGRKAKECLSEPGTVELWRRRRTIYVTGHLGFMETNDEWKSEITEINHLKKCCSWSRPQTNWEPIWLTHGKLSPFFRGVSDLHSGFPEVPSARARSAVQIHGARRPWCPRLDDLTNWNIAPRKRSFLRLSLKICKKMKTPKSPGLSSFSD